MDQTKDKNKRTFNNFLIIFFNSLSYFLIAFIFMYLLGQISTAIAAMQFEYSSIIYYYKLMFLIDSGAWNGDAVKLLYSMAPVVALIFGIIFLLLFIQIYDNLSNFKAFFLWCFAYAVIWSFGALLAGTILNKGIGYVVMYFYFMDTGKLIISLFALSMLLIISTFTTKWFLFSANSYFNELNEHNRAFFTFSHVIFPLLVGTAIMILVKLPKISYYELFVLLTGLVYAIPVLLRYPGYPTFFFDDFPIRIKLDKAAIIVAIFFVVAFRVVLEFGLKFSGATG